MYEAGQTFIVLKLSYCQILTLLNITAYRLDIMFQITIITAILPQLKWPIWEDFSLSFFSPWSNILFNFLNIFILLPWFQWLFFQNAIQVQLHGGKTPIVLYWEMKLNLTCTSAMSQLQLPCNCSTGQAPLPEQEISQGTPRTCTRCYFRKFRVPGGGLD